MLTRKIWMILGVLFLTSACGHHGHKAHAPYKWTVRHQVADYDKWRPVYDSHEKAREAAGLTRCKVQRGVDDPSIVQVTCDSADLEKAKAFAASADLIEAMKSAGVVGKPDIWAGTPAREKCE